MSSNDLWRGHGDPPEGQPGGMPLASSDLFASRLESLRNLVLTSSSPDVNQWLRDVAQAMLSPDTCLTLNVVGNEVDSELLKEQFASLKMGLISRAIVLQTPLVDNGSSDHWSSNDLGSTEVGPVLCAPVLSRGDVVTCLYLNRQQARHPFGEYEVRMATLISAVVGVVLDHLALHGSQV